MRLRERLGYEMRDHSMTLYGHCVREAAPHQAAKRARA